MLPKLFTMPTFSNGNWHPMRSGIQCPVAYHNTTWPSATAKSDKGSIITASKDKFQVYVDVRQFTTEDLTVKVIDNNTIIVEGKHEERRDAHGTVSRQFLRRYVLPDGYDINNIVSNLSLDRVLSITALHLDQGQGKEEHERTIPIQLTGMPIIKAVKENKKEDQREQKT